MRSMPIILIGVDEEERARFFLRFEKGLNDLGYKIIYVVDRFSVYKYMQSRCKYINEVIFLNRKMVDPNAPKVDLNTCLELRLHQATVTHMKLVFQAVWGIRNQVDWPVAYIFIWNGCKVTDYALTLLAQKYKIPTVYFEIANIPGKIFVDAEGTNAYSYLYKHPEILHQYDIDNQKYESWLQTYIRDKLQETTVKQAKKRSLWKSIQAGIIDVQGYCFYQGVQKRGQIWGKFVNRVKDKLRRRTIEDELKLPSKYLFFPLQVSTDTQIVIHAREGLESSLRKAIREAKRLGLWLVIKPHPADPYPSYVSQIIHEEHYNNVIITRMNTFRLILHAECIFTINSTVGLETMILDRPLVVVGRAFYENFKEEDVKRYIAGYLVNVDYWGKNLLKMEDLQQILKRAHYQG